jgi:AcrR family transcriptional regulator
MHSLFMPQHRKAHIERAIVDAAAHELAQGGLERASMQAIAERAGTSIGNLYKYFPDKQALYAAVVPPSLVRELRGLLDRRAREVHRGSARLPEALLDFALEHRPQLLFLLRHDVRFSEALVEQMVQLARSKAKPALRRTLQRIYRGWIATLASILAEEKSADDFREANALFLRYHLTGLKAVLRR